MSSLYSHGFTRFSLVLVIPSSKQYNTMTDNMMFAYTKNNTLIGGCKMKTKVDAVEWLYKNKSINVKYIIYKDEKITRHGEYK